MERSVSWGACDEHRLRTAEKLPLAKLSSQAIFPHILMHRAHLWQVEHMKGGSANIQIILIEHSSTYPLLGNDIISLQLAAS